MQFRTEVNPLPNNISFDLKDKVLLIGSCFSENIGEKLIKSRVNVSINPHGIVFNPLSVINCISDYISCKEYQSTDLSRIGEEYLSLNHHGSFRNENEKLLLESINNNIRESHDFLKKAKLLIITLGTSWTYYFQESNKPVANCHKLSNSLFEKKLVKSNHVLYQFSEIIKSLQQFNPELKVVFTVSPVRHWKDGVVENQLSKSHLLVLVNELVDKYENAIYFPSYEIMMDDLRDYRYYKDDMLHPSKLAINYIWIKFQKTFFSKVTREKVQKIEKLSKVFSHKPKNEKNHAIQVGKAKKEIALILEA